MAMRYIMAFAIAFLGATAALAKPSFVATRNYLMCGPPPYNPCNGKACTIIADEVDITVDTDGSIRVNGELVGQQKLLSYLRNWAREKDPLPVVIAARSDVPIGKFASVAKALRNAGFKNFSCEIE